MSYKTAYLESRGEYFHVYNRGVNRERIFFREDDYLFFLARIAEFLDRSELCILCYVLMPNHFHFLLRQIEPYAMARFFERLCDGYAKAINCFQGRSGHLFQGSYVPRWARTDEDVLFLSRYIHRNPVEAGLVSDSSDWQFSSAMAYCGGKSTEWLEVATILSHFPGKEEYGAFLNSGDGMLDKNLKRLTRKDW
jgi:putative transposase